MRIRLIFTSLAVLMVVSVAPSFSQSGPAIDSAVYFAFFREAAGHVALPPKSQASTLNGDSTDLVPQSIQDAIGITDEEAKAVADAAAGCDDEINALEASARALVFESRLRAANDEKPPDALAERLREIEARRAGIVMSHVGRLKSSLDAARFKVIEDFIRSRQSGGVFFPAVHAKKL